jgi:hypothetical protein
MILFLPSVSPGCVLAIVNWVAMGYTGDLRVSHRRTSGVESKKLLRANKMLWFEPVK